ncbi:fec operon regulator FecR [compost metagenome]
MKKLNYFLNRSDVPDGLQQDAQAWLRRLTSGEATDFDAQSFQRWRNAHPDHQAAFEEAKNQWRLLKPALGKLLTTNAAAAELHRTTMRSPVISRRAFLGAAASTVAVAGVALYSPLGLWPAVGEWGADYATATGEQRDLQLAQQVHITLNTRTRIRQVVQDGVPAGLDVLSGETAVDLTMAQQNFSVQAGLGRTLMQHGKFEVKYLEHRACITCLEGQARVEHPSGSRVIRARQQLIYDEKSIGEVAAIDPQAVSAWRRGELVFKTTPLPAVLDEINRYRPGRVILMGDALQAVTLSARFQIAELDTALLQIQHSFDLNSRSLPGGVLILS